MGPLTFRIVGNINEFPTAHISLTLDACWDRQTDGQTDRQTDGNVGNIYGLPGFYL